MSDTPPAPADVTVDLSAGGHVHQWRTVGQDEGGCHDLVCDCGAEGTGYGPFEPPAKEA